jgi:Cys-tRNA(Pro)/Cys-tRNA(Cys) deacylase
MTAANLPAHTYLEERGILYRKLDFPPETEKGAARVAQALGFDEGQMVKTLLFRTGAGELALVMLGGDQHAVSGQLKKALGSRNVSLADPETVLEVTGYAVGSIPPFHWQPPGFRSFLDAALTEYAELGVGAGVWGQEIIITPGNLIAASDARVVNLTNRASPVPVPE